MIRKVKGVKRVHAFITQTPMTSLGTRAKDTLITGYVKTALLAQRGLKSTQIKILTENRVVYVMGIAPRAQHAGILDDH